MTEEVIRILFAFIIVAGPLAFVIFVGRWGWHDARERQCSGGIPLLVAILVLVFFPIGLFVWLVARPKKRVDSAAEASRQAAIDSMREQR